MNTFIESSCPREIEAETESEKRMELLKETLGWFYRRGIQVLIKPNKHGYEVRLQQPQCVIVEGGK